MPAAIDCASYPSIAIHCRWQINVSSTYLTKTIAGGNRLCKLSIDSPSLSATIIAFNRGASAHSCLSIWPKSWVPSYNLSRWTFISRRRHLVSRFAINNRYSLSLPTTIMVDPPIAPYIFHSLLSMSISRVWNIANTAKKVRAFGRTYSQPQCCW